MGVLYDILNESGSIYIKTEYLGDAVYNSCEFEFSVLPKAGYWEVHYANRQRKDGTLPIGIVAPKKVCTCGCTCGAGGRGSSF